MIEKWECDFEQDKKTDPGLQAFLKEFELVEPMDPRDRFFGGRTGAVCLHAKATEPGEDPWVNKNCTYPVRHPQIYTNPQDQNIAHWFGPAKVDILHPEFLFHPVLPV